MDPNTAKPILSADQIENEVIPLLLRPEVIKSTYQAYTLPAKLNVIPNQADAFLQFGWDDNLSSDKRGGWGLLNHEFYDIR